MCKEANLQCRTTGTNRLEGTSTQVCAQQSSITSPERHISMPLQRHIAAGNLTGCNGGNEATLSTPTPSIPAGFQLVAMACCIWVTKRKPHSMMLMKRLLKWSQQHTANSMMHWLGPCGLYPMSQCCGMIFDSFGDWGVHAHNVLIISSSMQAACTGCVTGLLCAFVECACAMKTDEHLSVASTAVSAHDGTIFHGMQPKLPNLQELHWTRQLSIQQ